MGKRIRIRPEQDMKQNVRQKARNRCFVCESISNLRPYYRSTKYDKTGNLKGKIYLCRQCFSTVYYWLTHTKSKRLDRWNAVGRMRKYCRKYGKSRTIGHIYHICK